MTEFLERLPVDPETVIYPGWGGYVYARGRDEMDGKILVFCNNLDGLSLDSCWKIAKSHSSKTTGIFVVGLGIYGQASIKWGKPVFNNYSLARWAELKSLGLDEFPGVDDSMWEVKNNE